MTITVEVLLPLTIHDQHGGEKTLSQTRVRYSATIGRSSSPDGRNLASVLARIERETRDEAHSRGALTDVRNALVSLVAGIADVHVRYDETERRQRIELQTTEGLMLSARVASDRTLRMLALVAMLHDKRRPRVVCFEEPENGVYKPRLVGLINMLREARTDPTRDGLPDAEPPYQIIVNTHSPVVAKAPTAFKHDVIVSQTGITGSAGQPERVSRMRTYRTGPQGALGVGDAPRPLNDLHFERLTEVEDAFAT